jgi:peptide/nickel transport system substrate-binding protein
MLKSKKLISIAAALALVMALVLTGCSGDKAASSDAKDGKTLIYGSQDYTAINPALFEHGEINLLLFD